MLVGVILIKKRTAFLRTFFATSKQGCLLIIFADAAVYSSPCNACVFLLRFDFPHVIPFSTGKIDSLVFACSFFPFYAALQSEVMLFPYTGSVFNFFLMREFCTRNVEILIRVTRLCLPCSCCFDQKMSSPTKWLKLLFSIFLATCV